MYPIKVEKTVYAPKEPSDGKRILVMRIWPRGVQKASIDLWMKDLGTSRELIREWKTGRVTWAEFAKRYEREVRGAAQRKLIGELADQARLMPITLLCSCKDPARCHRGILKKLVEAHP